MKKIAAVIVTYNRIDKLKKTVQASLSEVFSDIVIVNNASTDETKEWLDSLNDSRLHIFHLSENIGGAGGFYEGFKYVANVLQSDWLVCYDDDAFPVQGTIETFISLEVDDNVASVAAAVYLPNGLICQMNVPRYNPFTSFNFYMDRNAYEKTENTIVDMSSFVGYFVRTSLIQNEQHFPTKDLFIYADDLIYSLYWTQQGYKHLFIPQLKFIHDTETLENTDEGVYSPLWKVYYIFRNGIELYRHMNRLSVYPYAVAKYLQLFSQIKKYPSNLQDPYRKLIKMALFDGLKRDFSKSFNQITTYSKNKDLP